MQRPASLSFLLALLLLPAPAPAQTQPGFKLKAGDRVVFYGDSITDQRLYTTFAESFVVTRFPSLPVTFTHSGWGGDRVGGGGGGNIDLRLERDVFPFNPTVMTIMLGMNDGSYKPFDENLFARFQTGFRHIVDSVKQHAPACRITLIQPSPYDDVTRAPAFEGGYNGVLIRYSEFLKSLSSSDNLGLADLNTPVVAMLTRARQSDPENAQKILPDRVHPAAAGHLIMAASLLKAWNAPALVAEVDIDAKATAAFPKNARVSNFGKAAALSWDELDLALPMPIDPADKLLNLAVDSSDVVEALDREILRVRNLAAPRFELRIDGMPVATVTREQLAAGINLARMDTPMLRQSLLVHRLTLERAAAHNIRWRQVQVPMKDASDKERNAALAALDKMDAELALLQREAAQPRSHHFELAAI